MSHTLEDTCRNHKVLHETAIPPGRYEVVLTNSPKYKRVMPRLLNVPNYEGILIHWGNESGHTDGCILVGEYNPEKPDWISSSRRTFDKLFESLVNVKEENIWINITGGFPHT